MQLTVFGGTGPTGRLLIHDALEAGHAVTAFARTPGKLPGHRRLTTVTGQLPDAAAVQRAIEGSHAVLSLLGTTRAADASQITTGYRTIVAGMGNAGVERLVALGTSSNTDPADTRELKADLAVKLSSLLFTTPGRLFVAIDEIVRASGLKWTLVRVPFLTNGPRTAHINVRMKGDKGGMRVSRANLAAFFLDQAHDTTWIGKAPYITDK